MRISCSTTIAHRSPLEEALARVKSLGFDHVDLLMAHGWAHVSPRDLVDGYDVVTDRVQRALAEHGLTVAALNLAFSGPLYGRGDEDIRRRREEAEAVVRLMRSFNIAVAAVQPGGRPHGIADTTLLDEAAESWRELTAIAEREGRRFALELHTGSPFDSPDAARELINRAPDTEFAFDPSHLVGQGIDLHQVAWILERAAHVHLRDAESGRVQVPFGKGTVDFDWILTHLKRRSYDGFVAVEFLDTDEFDVAESSRALAEMVRGFAT
ncbi:MAG: sugar phosphate isomerase/epimerase family protein [Spirochaetota bacterium]